MADIGKIRAELELSTDKFRAGVDKAKRQTKEIGQEAEKTTQSFKGMESALTALGANVALASMVTVMKSLVKESQNVTNAFVGLRSISESMGVSVDKATESAKRLADTGLVPLSSAAAGLKNLLSTGLSLDQANEMMEVFLDRAAFGKSESISMAQAIENLSQAFKTESSELGDLSGMTENFSYLLEQGAQQMGKSVNELTQLERAQAKYLGILQSSQPFIGDHVKLMDSYAGKSAQLNAKWTELRATLGDDLIPLFDEAITKMTPIIESTIEWTKENGELVTGITAGTVTATAFTAALSTLIPLIKGARVGFAALSASLGPYGLLAAGLAVIVPSLVAFTSGVDAARSASEKATIKTKELAAEYDSLKASADQLNEGTQEAVTAHERMKAIMQELNEIAPDVVKAYENETGAVGTLTGAIRDNTKAKIENLKAELARKEAELSDSKVSPGAGGIVGVNGVLNDAKQGEVVALRLKIKELEHGLAFEMTDNERLRRSTSNTRSSTKVSGAYSGGSTASGSTSGKTLEEIAAASYNVNLSLIRYKKELS